MSALQFFSWRWWRWSYESLRFCLYISSSTFYYA